MIELLISYFLFQIFGVNSPWNVSISVNSTSNTVGSGALGYIPTSVFHNITFYAAFSLLDLGIALYVWQRNDQGKDKFLFIAFVMMIFSWIYMMFGAWGPQTDPNSFYYPTFFSALYIITLIWVRSTR